MVLFLMNYPGCGMWVHAKTLTISACRHFHFSFLPLLHPFFDRDFKVRRLCLRVSSILFAMLCIDHFQCLIQTTLSRMLPEDVWHEVLECANPDEYAVLARQSAGVSREFYWLLKNSVTTIRIHRPVVSLCGLVWLQSRDTHFSSIKCVEGEWLPPKSCFSLAHS